MLTKLFILAIVKRFCLTIMALAPDEPEKVAMAPLTEVLGTKRQGVLAMIRETQKDELMRSWRGLRALCICMSVSCGGLISIIVVSMWNHFDPGFLLFIVPLILLCVALFYPVRRMGMLAWRVDVSDTALNISTLKREFNLGWESIADIQKCPTQHTFYYSVQLRDGTKIDLPATLDKGGALLPELRKHFEAVQPARSNADTVREYKLPGPQLVSWVFALPFIAWFGFCLIFGGSMGGDDAARHKLEAASGGLALATFMCCLMFVCTSLKVSRRGLTIRSLLGRWETSWDRVSMKWGYLKTPAGTFPVWQMGNFDQLQVEVTQYSAASQGVSSIISADQPRLKTVKSPGLILFGLAIATLFAPVAHAVWLGIALMATTLIDAARPSRNLLRTAFCVLACGVAYWTVSNTNVNADLNVPTLKAFLNELGGKQSDTVRLGKTERIQNYEISLLDMPQRWTTHIPDSFEYVKVTNHGSMFSPPMDQFFGVDPAPKGRDWPAADGNTAIELENAKWGAPTVVHQGGLTFNARRAHVTVDGDKLAAIEYIAIDHGKRVVFRAVGNENQEAALYERAEAVMHTFKKVGEAHVASTDAKTNHSVHHHYHPTAGAKTHHVRPETTRHPSRTKAFSAR